jgi:citrate lyase subunit beta/citryl-CoA lyase
MLTARSLLFLPGNRERFLAKAASLPADCVILDLEDSVPETEKEEARRLVLDSLRQLAGVKPVLVRVNAPDSPHFPADLAALVGKDGLHALMVPKVHGPDDLPLIERSLAVLEQERALAVGTTRLVVILESARAVLGAAELLRASPRVESICFGGARDGDLMADLGCDWSDEGRALLHARQHALLAARAAGCAWPLDGVFADVADAAAFERDTRLSRSLGYRGRTVIHPTQIEIANRVYSPSPDEIARCARLLEAFRQALAQGAATALFEGRMIDNAMAKAAQEMLLRAGRRPGSGNNRPV